MKMAMKKGEDQRKSHEVFAAKATLGSKKVKENC